MIWVDIWESITKEKSISRSEYFIYHLVVFFTYGGLTYINKTFILKPQKTYFDDIINTVMVCTLSFEHSLIYIYHGPLEYFCTALMAGIICYFIQLESEAVSSVNELLGKYLKCHISFSSFIFRMSLQIVCVVLAVYAVQNLWILQNKEYLALNINANNCVSQLHVPVLLGFLIECSATVLVTWFNFQRPSRLDVLNKVLKISLSLIIKITGPNYTRLDMNPTNALVKKYGCRGISKVAFLFIYCLGPIIGYILGFYMDNLIKK